MLWCLQSRFSSIWHTVSEVMSFEYFQDDRYGGHLVYQNEMILAILILHVAPMPSTRFSLNLTLGSGADVLSRCSSWPPRQPTWIAKRNMFSNSESLYTPMLPIKFRYNPTYGLGGDVILRISKWPPWQPSWTLEQNEFSNSESLCLSNASHQVSTQSDLRFGRRCRLKIFKMADMAAILDVGKEQF